MDKTIYFKIDPMSGDNDLTKSVGLSPKRRDEIYMTLSEAAIKAKGDWDMLKACFDNFDDNELVFALVTIGRLGIILRSVLILSQDGTVTVNGKIVYRANREDDKNEK